MEAEQLNTISNTLSGSIRYQVPFTTDCILESAMCNDFCAIITITTSLSPYHLVGFTRELPQFHIKQQ